MYQQQISKNNILRFILIFLNIFLLFNSCIRVPSKVCIKENKIYGYTRSAFRYKFNQYYERGIAYQQGECYDFAVKDFLNAIELENVDDRLMRTYGMHYIEYFPHRELGICYFYIGDYEKALIELEKSIQFCPSPKAYVYRDEARAKIINNQTHADIKIKANIKETQPYLTNSDPILLSGSIFCPQYIYDYNINNNQEYLEFAKKKINFKKKLLLEEGKHEINISAKSLKGAYSNYNIFINVDDLVKSRLFENQY